MDWVNAKWRAVVQLLPGFWLQNFVEKLHEYREVYIAAASPPKTKIQNVSHHTPTIRIYYMYIGIIPIATTPSPLSIFDMAHHQLAHTHTHNRNVLRFTNASILHLSRLVRSDATR